MAASHFESVKEFCGDDQDLFWEIIEEVEISMKNLSKTVTDPDQTIDQLKFVAHKMKSTFRILKDEDFKSTLDAYVDCVIKDEATSIITYRNKVLDLCKAYQEKLTEELSKRP